MAAGGEPVISTFAWYLDTWKIKQLSIDEAFDSNTLQAGFKRGMAEAWAATKAKTGTGRPIDALIGPCAPSASFPHDFPVWWGYYSLWNLLDYPTTILPVKSFQIDPERDAKDDKYVPKNNVFDSMNYQVCKYYYLSLFRPMTNHAHMLMQCNLNCR